MINFKRGSQVFLKTTLVFLMMGLSILLGAEQKRRIISKKRGQEKVALRSEPNTKGKVITELSEGIVVDEIDKTGQKDTFEGLANYWYKVALPDGTQGWVFGANAWPFDAKRQAHYYEDLYQELKSSLLQNLAMFEYPFSDYVYIFHLLDAVIPEVTDAEISAKLKLGQLMCLQRSLPFGVKNEPPEFAAWIAEQKEYIYYDEIRQQWLLKYNLLWKLHDEYKTLPVADDIAWEAANNPRGGECENDFLCILGNLNATLGKYLRLHPDGLYAPLALDGLISFFERCLEKPPDFFGKEYKGYPDPKPELELMRDTLRLVSETKDTRPGRALSQFEKTFEIYFKRDK